MSIGSIATMATIFLLVLIIGFLLTPVTDRPQILRKQCRALVLEGGGDKGAWEAGVIKGIVENLSEEEVQYDVVSGVSIGSVNAFEIATFPKGQEKEMADLIEKRWANLTSEDLYRDWGDSILGVAAGFKWRSGFLDNSPFKAYINKFVDEKNLSRILTIGVTDATNVEPLTFTGNDLSKENLKTIIAASTSMPAVFPYVEYEGKVLIDGGVLINADFKGAINKCKEIASSEEDIIIDAILPSGGLADTSLKVGKNYTAFEMYYKYKALVDYREKINDFMQARENYPKVQWRHIISPLKPLPSKTVPIWFTTESLREMIDMGKLDAYNWIKNPNNTLPPVSLKNEGVMKERFFH